MEQLVFPGDFLSREEEFSAGKNTYVGPSGRICSDSVGVPDFDKETREVSVSKKARVVKALGPGSVVLGKVLLVKENVVVLGLFEATHSGEERKMLHSSGTIMISRASTDFVKSLKQEFKVGDLVRAKVVSQNNYGTELSTEGRELGVVKAFCTRCRNPMQLFGAQLKCTSCGSVERRKLAERYMEK